MPHTSAPDACRSAGEPYDDDDEESETSNCCALHNLPEDQLCSSSSGCSSTTACEDDRCSIVDYLDDDSDSDDDDRSTASSASNESGGEGKAWRKSWTMQKILGNPTWLNSFKAKKFETDEQFETFKGECELLLQEVLCRHAYNTIGSFNQFYEDYKRVDKDESFEFDDFFINYKAKLKPDSLSCVGLSIRLLELFAQRFGQAIGDHCGTVSCEEIVKDPNKYNMHCDNTAKEHVLVAFKFLILNGELHCELRFESFI